MKDADPSFVRYVLPLSKTLLCLFRSRIVLSLLRALVNFLSNERVFVSIEMKKHDNFFCVYLSISVHRRVLYGVYY